MFPRRISKMRNCYYVKRIYAVENAWLRIINKMGRRI
jgi:hypothetical protein